ncbi:MAG: hypothetical protein R3D63_04180 [Paracoccaceae bacterium]
MPRSCRFSTQWYGKALANPFVMEALQTSATVAAASAVLATIAGTLAALALRGCAAGRG